MLEQMISGAMGPTGAEPGKLMAREAPDPVEQRSALVKHWTDRVIQARTYWTDKAFRTMRRDMDFAAGKQWPSGVADHMVDEASERYVANITLRHIASRTAAIYGKNPRVVARRKPRLMSTIWDGNITSLQQAMMAMQANPMDPQPMMIVQDAMQALDYNAKMDKIGKTLELLFENEIAEQTLPFKVQMKATVRRALTTAVGYVRLGYQRVMQNRPDVDAKINDVTQRLAAIERLSADLADGEIDPNAKEAEELRILLQSLASEEQILVREGLTFSYPDSTSIIPDTNCKQVRGFVGCGWVAEEFFLTSDKIKEIYKIDVKAGGATTYQEKGTGDFERHDNGGSEDKPGYFCVWEIFNKDDGMVYVVCDGYRDFMQEPSPPDVWLERFWPWFPFVVNEVYHPERVFPPSDVELMRDMQMELNRARQGLREHRRANRPITVSRKGALETEDKDKLQNCQAHEVIELAGLQPGEHVKDVLQAHSGPAIDYNLYDPGPAYEDYMRTLGQHEASLGGTSGATATEASIAEGSRVSHVGSTVDDLDEFLTELARAAGQVLLSEASPERVKEVVGPGAVWPDLSRDQIAKEIYLDVEAASTGRPNQAQQVQVAQQIFPMLMQIPGVSPEWMAKELLRRMDDRTDLVDAFAPNLPSVAAMNRVTPSAPGSPEAQASGKSPQDQGPRGADNTPDTAPAQVNAAPRPGAGQAQMPAF